MQQLAEAEVRALNQDISLFDQRKRYGPTGQVRLHSPPRLDKNLVHALRAAAVHVFQVNPFVDACQILRWPLLSGYCRVIRLHKQCQLCCPAAAAS